MTPKLSDRLSKLFPMLASDKDGEVLATARAIRAALASEGLDFHDLVATLSGAEIVLAQRATQIAAAPTWSSLTLFERRAWSTVILSDPALGPLERDRLGEVDATLRVGMCGDPHWRRIRLFDERLAICHARGARP